MWTRQEAAVLEVGCPQSFRVSVVRPADRDRADPVRGARLRHERRAPFRRSRRSPRSPRSISSGTSSVISSRARRSSLATRRRIWRRSTSPSRSWRCSNRSVRGSKRCPPVNRTTTTVKLLNCVIAAARARGKRLGRPRRHVDVTQIEALRGQGRSWRDVGRVLGIGAATARAAFQSRAKNPSDSAAVSD
jgi:hypothetical protein